MPKLQSVKIGLNIPFIGNIDGTWAPNEDERNASWELYVELVTRTSVVPLKDNQGILREVLDSFYDLFIITRKIMKNYGPSIAEPRKKNEYSFGKLSIIILNYVIRPLLTKWHPLLQNYEATRDENVSVKEHEDNWEYNKELREELENTRKILLAYSKQLAKVAKIKPLYPLDKRNITVKNKR